MSTEWFKVQAERGGVTISGYGDPLDFTWQDPEQVREIIAKLEAALGELEAQRVGRGQ